MQFECEVCHYKLINYFCPKCGRRMTVECDECDNRTARIAELETKVVEAVKEHRSAVQVLRDGYALDVQELRGEYDSTVERQRHELEDQSAELNRLQSIEAEEQKIQERAWAQVAAALEISLPIGYVINESRVLQQLKIERNAAAILRAELQELKREREATINEFARQREDFIAKLQDRNGAKKLEAAPKEV